MPPPFSTQMLLMFGALLSALARVSVTPERVQALVSTVPLGITIETVPLAGRPAALSMVITVVVAATIRPPRRAPERTGSAMSITCPGRTSTPASMLAVKLTTSVSYWLA